MTTDKMEIELSEDPNPIDWEELAHIFELAPLGRRDPKKLEIAFRNSEHKYFAYAGEKLIGCGRAINDGIDHAVIFDVVVLPEYQGQGVGRAIMQRLIEEIRKTTPSILLYSAIGKEGFYQKLGFRKMKTAMALFNNPEPQERAGYIE